MNVHTPAGRMPSRRLRAMAMGWQGWWVLGFALGLSLSDGRAAETLLGPRIPPTEPNQAASTFTLRPGFRAEVVAAEPRVTSPVALSVDERGQAYVVEMRDYSERRPEQLGRVRRLSAPDSEGRYQEANVFLGGLPWPTAIACWDGGVFIGATPDILYAKDTDGDGIADVHEVVFTGFANDYAPYATNQLNVQALMNSFQWAPDGRLHGATSVSGGKVRLVDSEFTRRWRQRARTELAALGVAVPASDALPVEVDLRGRDFSFDPRTLELRAETGGGQHGMSFDTNGRRFVCSNSDHLQLVVFDEASAPVNRFHELPTARRSIAADGAAAEVFRRSPDEPWRVVRTRWRVSGVVPGMIEGGGRPSGYFTGATGVTIYRGDAYGPEFDGDAFIADCGSNLIHRKKLRPAPDGVSLVGERAADEAKSEFLASRDNWFRPVQFYNAPDGCLWVIDMYREVIEHPWSLPALIKAELDLDSGRDRGRLWRVAPAAGAVPGFRLQSFAGGVENLVDTLAHPNGWHRDTANRLLTARADTNSVAALRQRAQRWTQSFPTASPEHAADGRLQLLYLLAGYQALEPEALLQALRDSDPRVRRHALHLLRTGPTKLTTPAVESVVLQSAATERDPLVQFELALALGRASATARVEPLLQLVKANSSWVQSAAIHSAGEADLELWKRLIDVKPLPASMDRGDVLTELAETIGRRGDSNAVSTVLAQASRLEPLGLGCRLVSALGEGCRRGGRSLGQMDRDGNLAALLTRAQEQVRTANPSEVSPAAVKLLTWLPSDATTVILVSRLSPANSDAVRDAALSALARGQGEVWARALGEASQTAPPPIRTRVLALLVSRPEGAREVLRRVGAGTLPFENLDASTIAALRGHANPEVRAQARTVLGEPPASRQAVVEAFAPALEHNGDPGRGAMLFQERCATCHAWRGQGVALGPDLASVALNGKEKLLVSILDPNREVAPNFTAWTVETQSGETHTGLLIRRSPEAITLRQAGGAELTLATSAVREIKPEGRSLMPEGLESGLDAQRLADLLAFLTAP